MCCSRYDGHTGGKGHGSGVSSSGAKDTNDDMLSSASEGEAEEKNEFGEDSKDWENNATPADDVQVVLTDFEDLMCIRVVFVGLVLIVGGIVKIVYVVLVFRWKRIYRIVRKN